MHLFYLLVVCVLLSSGCATNWIQVVQVASPSKQARQTEKTIEFENDTLKVVYYFWDNRGVMSFAVFNKLGVPIYIDWKKSAGIINGTKFDYWVDTAATSIPAYYQNFAYDENVLYSTVTTYNKNEFKKADAFNDGMNQGMQVGTQLYTKAERISFIPPNSQLTRQFMHLANFDYIDYDPNRFTTESVPSTLKEGNYVAQISSTLSKDSSFLKFRNYLTFSTSDKFDTAYHVSHPFHVSKISMVKEAEFKGPDLNGEAGKNSYPLRRGDRFYLYYPIPFK
jgi:hypothetical protein